MPRLSEWADCQIVWLTDLLTDLFVTIWKTIADESPEGNSAAFDIPYARV